MITNDARQTHQVKPRVAVVKAGFNKKKIHLTSKLGSTLRLLMSYIYGAPIFDVSRSHTTTQHSR